MQTMPVSMAIALARLAPEHQDASRNEARAYGKAGPNNDGKRPLQRQFENDRGDARKHRTDNDEYFGKELHRGASEHQDANRNQAQASGKAGPNKSGKEPVRRHFENDRGHARKHHTDDDEYCCK